MKVIVCGGRNFWDKDFVFFKLDEIHSQTPITLVIHGAPAGADSLANAWANENKIQRLPCPANWKDYGKRAGIIRNAEMLALNPNMVIAFPGGTGTQNMIDISKNAGFNVVIFAVNI